MAFVVSADRHKDRVHVRFLRNGQPAYDENAVARVKKIPNARWADSIKSWTFPLNWYTCIDLRKKFGKYLRVEKDLAIWARLEKNRMDDLRRIVRMKRCDLPVLEKEAPKLWKALNDWPFQTVDVAWLVRNWGGLIGNHPGLGKTLEAAATIIEAGITGPILVMAPKNAAIITWPDELDKWLPEDDHIVQLAHLTGEERRTYMDRWLDMVVNNPPAERMWMICNGEMARIKLVKDESNKPTGDFETNYPVLFDTEWSAHIVDESHKLLICRTNELIKMSQQRAGMAQIPLAEGGMRLAMSGTPYRGKKQNAWGTFNWIWPDEFSSFWNWINTWFQTFENSDYIGDIKEGLEREYYRHIHSRTIRRTKAEVAPQLPPKRYMDNRKDPDNDQRWPGIWLPLKGEQRRQYRAMLRSGTVELDGGTLYGMGLLSMLTRLKQFASSCGRVEIGADGYMQFFPTLPSNKLDWILEVFLEERGIIPDADGQVAEEEQKVIIASQYTKLLKLFSSEFNARGIDHHIFTGETPAGKRADIKRKFQLPGGPRVILLQSESGGTSLTLDAADDLLFVDESGVPDNEEQVEDRIHRLSRMHQCNIWYLRSEDTIEEDIAITAGERDDIQKMILDGSRGVDYAKKILSIGAER